MSCTLRLFLFRHGRQTCLPFAVCRALAYIELTAAADFLPLLLTYSPASISLSSFLSNSLNKKWTKIYILPRYAYVQKNDDDDDDRRRGVMMLCFTPFFGS